LIPQAYQSITLANFRKEYLEAIAKHGTQGNSKYKASNIKTLGSGKLSVTMCLTRLVRIHRKRLNDQRQASVPLLHMQLDKIRLWVARISST